MSYNREKQIINDFKSQDNFLGIDDPGDGKNENGKYDKELEKDDLLVPKKI